MTIERDKHIKFHERGTLDAVTRWVARHDEGMAEWLKNARSAYRPDRAKVAEEHRVAVLLLRDADASGPARVGLLDVGGATLRDVTLWSVWQDPEASTRRSGLEDEGNQGNGGKAYMYRMFSGVARILGVHAGRRNCKGFEGEVGTVERGTPGFIPDAPRGRDREVDWRAEIDKALDPYGLKLTKLPEDVQAAVKARQAFTLVEGVEPANMPRGKIPAEALVASVLRHEQSTLAIQQLRLYVVHDGRLMNEGKPYALDSIAPYPGFHVRKLEVPNELKIGKQTISTTEGGSKPAGTLTVHTSRENMLLAYRNLKPRWKLTYRTENQMVGSKPIAELLPSTPGSYFVYATLELPALEPAYVDLGRRRPKDGPLVEAVDQWVAEQLRAVAKQITDKRRTELDEKTLDDVHRENVALDRFKNRFLPTGEDDRGEGRSGKGGAGPAKRDEEGEATAVAEELVPAVVELAFTGDKLRVGRGVGLDLGDVLGPQPRDAKGRAVQADVSWHLEGSAARAVEGRILGVERGTTVVWASAGEAVSRKVPVEVWSVSAVLVVPDVLEMAVGQRRQLGAKVTNDLGEQSDDVYLEWRSTEDLVVRIRPTGWVSGNRVGTTQILAGAGTRKDGAWSKAVTVTVAPSEERPPAGGGFPRLLVTGRDVDPATGKKREGDPDSPALWQEVTDYFNNVWWVNLSSPEAAFAFSQRAEQPELWRAFHVGKLIEMVVQVYMQQEYTRQGEAERREPWAIHRDAMWRHQAYVTSKMWARLQPYVATGKLE